MRAVTDRRLEAVAGEPLLDTTTPATTTAQTVVFAGFTPPGNVGTHVAFRWVRESGGVGSRVSLGTDRRPILGGDVSAIFYGDRFLAWGRSNFPGVHIGATETGSSTYGAPFRAASYDLPLLDAQAHAVARWLIQHLPPA